MNIYRENIMDHYKNPRNMGEIENPDVEGNDTNTSCDDKMRIQIKLNGNKIEDVKFSGVGCAISIASASILTEFVKGKTIQEVKDLSYEDVNDMLGVELDVARTRCATLSLTTLKKALEEKNGNERTL